MGKKIFVSYKYSDNQVKNLRSGEDSTVRDYVDDLMTRIDNSDDIFKGEEDNEDLSKYEDDTIWSMLTDRIYDSSVTVVFISPGMKEEGKLERDQWIPWEVSYSLKETSRKNKNGQAITSHSNAMVAVVLPDSNGSYSYYLEPRTCCDSKCTTHHTDKLFSIISKNKFNRIKNESKRTCDNNKSIWTGTCSYIEAVKWEDFIKDYKKYVDKAVERQENIGEYKIYKELD
ncbi:MAG: TIR domain-containing protein [Clostridiales bacterium]|nr:TIR domain-containing protein [Clostridiales bacterium]